MEPELGRRCGHGHNGTALYAPYGLCPHCGDSKAGPPGWVRVSFDDLKERAMKKLGSAAGNDFYVDPYLIRLVLDAALGEDT